MKTVIDNEMAFDFADVKCIGMQDLQSADMFCLHIMLVSGANIQVNRPRVAAFALANTILAGGEIGKTRFEVPEATSEPEPGYCAYTQEDVTGIDPAPYDPDGTQPLRPGAVIYGSNERD